jgi:hypothetical protein
MNMQSRHELTKSVLPRYLAADKIGKGRILDEYCANTGYPRKYAIAKLKKYQYTDDLSHKVAGRHERKRKKVYDAAVRAGLAPLWEAADNISSKLFHPYLPELLRVMKTHKEIELDPAVEEKLLAMSHGTCANLLDEIREYKKKKLQGTTKPGTLLKSQIPLRAGPWQESKPGYAEIDLVAHCGESAAGEFAFTLDFTDIATGWIERRAVLGRPQERTHAALNDIKKELPFRLLGIDSDNDSTFINHELWRWCNAEQITFTRSRPYKKNDNAHIEQKNWTCVRKVFGYVRIDTPAQVKLMNGLYCGPLRAYTNFFKPVMKCIEKKRVGAKIVKRYDRPRTPYERVVESADVPEAKKRELRAIYAALNPVALRREIDRMITMIHELKKQDRTIQESAARVVKLPIKIPSRVG